MIWNDRVKLKDKRGILLKFSNMEYFNKLKYKVMRIRPRADPCGTPLQMCLMVCNNDDME